MILVITLKSGIQSNRFKNGRTRGLEVTTTHRPEARVFSDLWGANSFLETNTEEVLGAYELNRDLTGYLECAILPAKGTKEVKQIVIPEEVLEDE